MQLTSTQKKAVEWNSGPLLIIAGAGSGKTTVLVEKIKYLLDKKLARPEEILALTFTEKAAREMESRVDQALPYGVFQMHIATFHSFCDQILRDEAIHIGLSSGYKLQTPAQSILFIKENIFKFKLNYFQSLGNPTKFVEGLLQHFSRLRDENISPKDYLKWAEKQIRSFQRHSGKRGTSASRISNNIDSGQARMTEMEKYLELANAYHTFQELKIKENIFDFADLIFYTNKLFIKRPNIRVQYQKRFKYVLVDEFQDTNIAQYELIKLLAPPEANPHLTVIGDDNQSIYKFRGAAVSNILQFMKEYKKASNIVLLENFRSTQPILDTAYRVIINNNPDTLEAKLNISKNLKSRVGKGTDHDVVFYLAEHVEQEAEYVAQSVLSMKEKNQELSFSDFAVLLRANNHADPFVSVFQRFGIPYQFLGPGMLFKQPEVKDLVSYLKVLYDVGDSAALFRLLQSDIFNIDEEDLARLVSFTRITGLYLFDALKIYLSFYYPEYHHSDYENYKSHIFIVKKETLEKFKTIYLLLVKGLKQLKKDTAGQILFSFFEESGLLQKVQQFKTLKEEREALNISKLFERLKTFEMEHEDASVHAVVDYISMSMDLGESPLAAEVDWSEYNAVNLLTVHSAKGLEFTNVFLVNLTNGRFPTLERREKIPISDELIKEELPQGNYHIQEERRLFYVALTRAKKKLILTASNYYGEGKRSRKLSPFVFEAMGKDYIDSKLAQYKESLSQLTIFDADKLKSSFTKPTEKEMNLKNKPDTFSYSQINTYEICPLRYKYAYVLKIPTHPNFAASFGQSIHEALYQFYSLVEKGENPGIEKLLEFYKVSWIPFGYKSKIHADRMKIEGQTFLKKFYKKFYDSKTTVLALEQKFKIKLDKNLYLTGKIDRVDEFNGKSIEIIDYKTGSAKTEEDIKKDLQLPLYALAATNKGLYNKKPSEVIVSFYFLQDAVKISQIKTEKEIQKAKEKAINTISKITEKKFEPKVGPWCSFCPFRINCEAWQ